MRPCAMVLSLAALAAASWQTVGQTGTDSRPDPRSAALGSVFWTDSSRYDLFSLAGNPVGLVHGSGKKLSVTIRTSGVALSGSGTTVSESHPVGLLLATEEANKYGLRVGVDLENQELSAGEASPDYKSVRLRWGLDVGANLWGDRYLVAGFGLHGRFPSSQTQDTTGNAAAGTFEHWQPALEALRLSLGSRIADFLTLTARVEAAASVDSLNHTPDGTTSKSLHRTGRVLLPWWGIGAQFERPGLPATGVVEYGFGTAYRMGVVKPAGTMFGTTVIGGENIDMPQLTTDSSRFLLATIGRIDRLPGHVFRPALAFHMISSETQAYAPIPGAQSTDFSRKGDALKDTNWTYKNSGFALGLGWEWSQGVKAAIEWERASLKLSRGAGLQGGVSDDHVDHRVSMGIEVGHIVVPALREAFPAGAAACVRVGLRKQSLAGMELEPGFLSGLAAFNEPEPFYRSIPNARNWAGMEPSVGLDPQLGDGGDETAISLGLGGSLLDGRVGLDATLIFDSWKDDGTDSRKLSGTGWNVGVHWSM